MSEKIVVSFRMSHAGFDAGLPRGYLERARALTKRAEALGASLVAWGAVMMAFAWDTDGIEEAVTLVAGVTEDAAGASDAWACGVAQGELDRLAPEHRAELSWGTALLHAVSLARVAKPGEVLIDSSVEALRAGDLLSLGTRVATDAGRRVRGARLDRRQPWRRDAAAQVARIVEGPLVGRAGAVEALIAKPGTIGVLRADPGLGGSRVLAELWGRIAPAPCLALMPAGLAAEPLGGIRRAFARIAASEPLKLPAALHASLDRLLNADGVTFDVAAALVNAYLQSTEGIASGILIDDAGDIDSVSLEVCARAASRAERPVVVVLRLDAMKQVPENLAGLPRGAEVELKPLDARDAQRLAEGCTGGALTPEAASRWAKRGGFTPLGVVSAIASAITTGELAWIDDTAFGRRRSSGKGKPRPASHWMVQRAEDLAPPARAVLSAIALLGGETSLVTLTDVLKAIGAPVDAAAELPKLARAQWVREPQAGWVALLSRTHREAILELVHDGRSRAWHRAVAQTIERTGGALVRAEAAYHAAKAGDGPWAAKLALVAARAASESQLEGSAMRLVAFARKEDPGCEEEVRREIVASSARRSSFPPPESVGDRTLVRPSSLAIPVVRPLEGSALLGGTEENADSEPPTIMRTGPQVMAAFQAEPSSTVRSSPAPRRDHAGMSIAVEGESPESVAARLIDLAKEALHGGDVRALERWCNGLVATGERERLVERMQAMAQLSHGQIAHAVLALRRARESLEDAASPARCQASLALGVALAHAGHPQEALLHALDALARAREAIDANGTQACMLFLAKLFDGVAREAEATRLRAAVRPA